MEGRTMEARCAGQAVQAGRSGVSRLPGHSSRQLRLLGFETPDLECCEHRPEARHRWDLVQGGTRKRTALRSELSRNTAPGTSSSPSATRATPPGRWPEFPMTECRRLPMAKASGGMDWILSCST